MVGPKPEGLSQALDGLGKVLGLKTHRTEIVVRRCVVGSTAREFFQVALGRYRVAATAQDLANCSEKVDVFWSLASSLFQVAPEGVKVAANGVQLSPEKYSFTTESVILQHTGHQRFSVRLLVLPKQHVA